MTDTTPRGDLSRQQKDQLLEAVNPNRILQANGHSHLSQQDVRAHLIRIFDFGHFDIEVIESACVFEEHRAKSPQDSMQVWEVCYRAQVRLTLRNDAQQLVAILEDGATATSEGMRSRGGAHDLAYKSAISLAIKRAATSLGDQFGLSLYNRGQQSALVKMTLESQSRSGNGNRSDVQAGIEQQTDLGLDYTETVVADEPQEPAAPSAKPPATKRATRGAQGTKRAPAAAPEPVEPEPTPEPTPAAPEPAPAPPAPEEPAAPSVDEAEAAEAAERARIAFEQQAKVEAEDAAAEAQGPAAEPREETGDEVAARIKAERAARISAGPTATPQELADKAPRPVTKPAAEAQAIVQAEPEPWAGDPRNWKARMAAAKDLVTLKQVWDDATSVREMTTELRAEISRRKAEIQRELAAPPAPEGDTPGVLDGSI